MTRSELKVQANRMFETFDHTADIGLRVKAASFEELCVEAARGFSSLIVANLATVKLVEERQIHLIGDAPDYLFFDWLNELVFLLDGEHLVFAEFEVTRTEQGLTALCRGESLDAARHQLEHEVKAITYHDLVVKQTEQGWEAEVILDI